jgi:hypothetical protein
MNVGRNSTTEKSGLFARMQCLVQRFGLDRIGVSKYWSLGQVVRAGGSMWLAAYRVNRKNVPFLASSSGALPAPTRCGSLLTQNRSGPRVPERVATLFDLLQDRCDETRGYRRRPDRSQSLGDSGHIFSPGIHCPAASYLSFLTRAVLRPESQSWCVLLRSDTDCPGRAFLGQGCEYHWLSDASRIVGGKYTVARECRPSGESWRCRWENAWRA